MQQNKHTTFARLCVGLLGLFLVAMALSSCSFPGSRDSHEVVYWTTATDPITTKAQQAIIDAFDKANPDLHVRMVGMPSQGTGDSTSLITAVRGGSPPDAYMIDRFTVSQQASVGLLQDLTPYESKNPGLENGYLPFAWGETQYQGHSYGLPLETDARAIYYNKDLLKQAGIDPSELDPSHGPVTVDKLWSIAQKLNKTDSHGNYTQIGFIPWAGEGEHATWALDFGAKYFNQQQCQVTLTEPAIMQAYQDYQKWAQQLNYSRVATFLATYQPPNAPPSQTPFFTGHLAMSIDGNWNIASLQQYAPKLNYGVTYLPRQQAGEQPFTWSGGMAVVMPRGAPNADGGYRFIRYMTGAEGQKIYAQITGHLPTWKDLYNDKSLFQGNQQFFGNLMQYSTSRVPLPVGAQLWDAMTTAQQDVLLGNKSPQQALQEAQARIQPQMQQYCPFKIS
ncbi:sugar ABC transporter substrate-binding protein [Dictyobacter sp. S3.2.2.5]|uniref:Sugar ABC transporter substrate-binding protein n=1 Tax=Dictyobacter halimunensis TaxID=3026934 RepID=A0ABQ6FXL5_9CHLR|nr:sugar ABC transporter substrate-binding protein [Dictyobacter sp. S3.2.2.5]